MSTHRPVLTLVTLLAAFAITALGAAPAGAVPEDFYQNRTTAEVVPTVVESLAEDAVDIAPDAAPGRPCFLVRAHWNTALDHTQPLC